MSLKITQLRLSSLRNRKKKEWEKINRFSESYGHHQTYQHMHNGNLSRRGERKRGRKNTWRYIGRKLQNLVKKSFHILHQIYINNIDLDLWVLNKLPSGQQTSSMLNSKRPTPINIIIKLSNQEENFESSKREVTHHL